MEEHRLKTVAGEGELVLPDRPSAGLDSKRRQKRVSGFATEREARRVLAHAKVDIGSGRLRHAARRTVGDLANEWLDAVRPTARCSSSISKSCVSKVDGR